MKTLKHIFIPIFSELTLFAMGFTCLLFLMINISFFRNISFDSNTNGALIISVILFAGILLSLYHAFSKRKKSSIEKMLLLLFAVIMSGFSGIWAGTYLLGHEKGIMLFFPIWNILNGYFLIVCLKEFGMDDNRISDEDATLLEVLISAAIATGLFLTSKYVLHHNWAVTFSLCVAYSTNLNGPIVSLIAGKNKATRTFLK